MGIVSALSACAPPTCERAVHYQENQLIIKGTEVPLGKTLGTGKIGEVDVSQPVLQQADTTTKLLDIQQYNMCLNMERATSPNERMFYATQQQNALNALIELAVKLNDSRSPNSTQNAIAEANQKSTAIGAAAPPPPSSPAPPTAPSPPSPSTAPSSPSPPAAPAPAAAAPVAPVPAAGAPPAPATEAPAPASPAPHSRSAAPSAASPSSSSPAAPATPR
jgi:hypothetical protein